MIVKTIRRRHCKPTGIRVPLALPALPVSSKTDCALKFTQHGMEGRRLKIRTGRASGTHKNALFHSATLPERLSIFFDERQDRVPLFDRLRSSSALRFHDMPPEDTASSKTL